MVMIKKQTKENKMSKIIGSTGVDSGQLLITDPCYIQYKKTGKSIETIFLSIMAILFVISYFILIFYR